MVKGVWDHLKTYDIEPDQVEVTSISISKPEEIPSGTDSVTVTHRPTGVKKVVTAAEFTEPITPEELQEEALLRLGEEVQRQASIQEVPREYPPDIESRPGYYRAGSRSPWCVYRVVDSSDRRKDERYAVLFDPEDGPKIATLLNAILDKEKEKDVG